MESAVGGGDTAVGENPPTRNRTRMRKPGTESPTPRSKKKERTTGRSRRSERTDYVTEGNGRLPRRGPGPERADGPHAGRGGAAALCKLLGKRGQPPLYTLQYGSFSSTGKERLPCGAHTPKTRTNKSVRLLVLRAQTCRHVGRGEPGRGRAPRRGEEERVSSPGKGGSEPAALTQVTTLGLK